MHQKVFKIDLAIGKQLHPNEGPFSIEVILNFKNFNKDTHWHPDII